jgi:hypothetical protein
VIEDYLFIFIVDGVLTKTVLVGSEGGDALIDAFGLKWIVSFNGFTFGLTVAEVFFFCSVIFFRIFWEKETFQKKYCFVL